VEPPLDPELVAERELDPEPPPKLPELDAPPLPPPPELWELGLHATAIKARHAKIRASARERHARARSRLLFIMAAILRGARPGCSCQRIDSLEALTIVADRSRAIRSIPIIELTLSQLSTARKKRRRHPAWVDS
jgi:hypothetical protein